MSSRSKKVGYIRMSNDRIHFESLMFNIFPHSISAVLVLIWKIKSLNGSMILFFRYKLHVYDISIYFQGHWNNFIFRFLILLHNCLHFLENIFDLWFEIQTDGGKRFLGRVDPPPSHPILVRCPCCLQYFTMQIQQYGKI